MTDLDEVPTRYWNERDLRNHGWVDVIGRYNDLRNVFESRGAVLPPGVTERQRRTIRRLVPVHVRYRLSNIFWIPVWALVAWHYGRGSLLCRVAARRDSRLALSVLAQELDLWQFPDPVALSADGHQRVRSLLEVLE